VAGAHFRHTFSWGIEHGWAQPLQVL